MVKVVQHDQIYILKQFSFSYPVPFLTCVVIQPSFNSFSTALVLVSIPDTIPKNGWNHGHSLIEKPLQQTEMADTSLQRAPFSRTNGIFRIEIQLYIEDSYYSSRFLTKERCFVPMKTQRGNIYMIILQFLAQWNLSIADMLYSKHLSIADTFPKNG